MVYCKDGIILTLAGGTEKYKDTAQDNQFQTRICTGYLPNTRQERRDGVYFTTLLGPSLKPAFCAECHHFVIWITYVRVYKPNLDF
jgi:hypothetical protein